MLSTGVDRSHGEQKRAQLLFLAACGSFYGEGWVTPEERERGPNRQGDLVRRILSLDTSDKEARKSPCETKTLAQIQNLDVP